METTIVTIPLTLQRLRHRLTARSPLDNLPADLNLSAPELSHGCRASVGPIPNRCASSAGNNSKLPICFKSELRTSDGQVPYLSPPAASIARHHPSDSRSFPPRAPIGHPCRRTTFALHPPPRYAAHRSISRRRLSNRSDRAYACSTALPTVCDSESSITACSALVRSLAHIRNEVLNPCTVARSASPQSRSTWVSVLSLIALPERCGDGNISPEPSSNGRTSRNTASAARDGGIRCSLAPLCAQPGSSRSRRPRRFRPKSPLGPRLIDKPSASRIANGLSAASDARPESTASSALATSAYAALGSAASARHDGQGAVDALAGRVVLDMAVRLTPAQYRTDALGTLRDVSGRSVQIGVSTRSTSACQIRSTGIPPSFGIT